MLAVQVGDKVTRLISADRIPMELTVTQITDTRIVCGAWEFDKRTGGEIDEDLGYDGVTRTLSYIRKSLPKTDKL
jgi:hypothetical protein